MLRCYLYYNNLKKYIDFYKKKKKSEGKGITSKIEKLNKTLFALIAKKEELRKFLLDYKEKFESEFGRSLTTQKDLNPILKEFNEY